ncbi:MAG: peptide chain release factor N(5)-glutamine methyltransferase [Candidatus Doudnabacteria bacterium]
MNIQQLLLMNSDIEAELLLPAAIGQTKEFLFVEPYYELTPKQLSTFLKFAKLRRQGKPIAYVLGTQPFFDLDLKVNPSVLIPRPETEWLAAKAKQLAQKLVRPRIIDVGTGSGAIAIFLATKLKGKALICASDISIKALTVAKANAEHFKLKSQIKFYHTSLLDKIPGKFDIIVANLPYVPISDYKKLKNNLKFEPKSAITDGTDNSKLILELLDQSLKKLTPKGKVLLEIDPSSVEHIEAWAEHIKPLYQVKLEFYQDLKHLNRYAIIKSST